VLQGHVALRGNAYSQIITNPRGEIAELLPIHPDRVRIELLRSGEFRYRVTRPIWRRNHPAAWGRLASAGFVF
jgi:phage portal protein BeeE